MPLAAVANITVKSINPNSFAQPLRRTGDHKSPFLSTISCTDKLDGRRPDDWARRGKRWGSRGFRVQSGEGGILAKALPQEDAGDRFTNEGLSSHRDAAERLAPGDSGPYRSPGITSSTLSAHPHEDPRRGRVERSGSSAPSSTNLVRVEGRLKKVVIYTRYSSEMQRAESCEDQEREVREGLARRGIDTREIVVIQDRAESGTKTDRPGLTQLLRMVERGEVAVLAVDDQSRLSRSDNASCVINDLDYNGVRFIAVNENLDTHQDGWRMRVKISEMHNSFTIHELGHRVQRGQRGRVLDDGAAGDHPLGYESFFLDPADQRVARGGPKPKKGLRIREEEARWVLQIFEWFDLGWAIREITRELTRRGVDKGRRATTPAWHQHQVRRILGNEKYAGIWTWGKTRTLRRSDGKVRHDPVPPEDWTVRSRPDLRIVEEDLWKRSQERLRRLAEEFGPKAGQRRRGPQAHHKRVYPPTLLHGAVRCAGCGATLWVHSGEKDYLHCPNHPRGTCSMSCRAPLARAEKALLDLVAEILSSWPPWLSEAIAALRRALQEAAEFLPQTLRADEVMLKTVRDRIGNLVDSLADGVGDSAAIRGRLRGLEREAAELAHRIDTARASLVGVSAMPDDEWIRAQLSDVPSLLRDDPRRAAPSAARRCPSRVRDRTRQASRFRPPSRVDRGPPFSAVTPGGLSARDSGTRPSRDRDGTWFHIPTRPGRTDASRPFGAGDRRDATRRNALGRDRPSDGDERGERVQRLASVVQRPTASDPAGLIGPGSPRHRLMAKRGPA